jgi:hypothetical protein
MAHLKLVVDNIANPSSEWTWSPNNPALQQMLDDDKEVGELLAAECRRNAAPVLVSDYDTRGLVARRLVMKRQRQSNSHWRALFWNDIRHRPKCEVIRLGAF